MRTSLIAFPLVYLTVVSSCDRNNASTAVDDSISETDTNHADSAESAPSSDSAETSLKFCDDNYSFYINNDYKVQNNVWGFSSNSFENYLQCIFHDSRQGRTFGWEWQLNGISNFPSYPRVEYGWNPWLSESTTEHLPRLVRSLKTVNVSFEKDFSSDGKYNTSFDLWLSGMAVPTSENIRAEVMIWLDADLAPETSLEIENLGLEGETFDLYKNTDWNAFPLFIFHQKSGDWDGQINILSFLSYLVEYNHISSEDYLADIEFGNEIWSGSGYLRLTDYEIEIE